MKDFIHWLIKSIVDQPDVVDVEEINEGDQVSLRVKVAVEDMGKVIGKGGKIIKSVRILARIRGIKEGKRVNVDLVEP